jgi:uncharacterized protein YabE (DUF348 family)
LLRTIRYGFSAAVIAGVVGGVVAWGHVDKTVSLVVDGQTKSIHTTAGNVGDVLANAGYKIGAHDLLAPGIATHIHNGTEIVLRRGRLLNLNVDGRTTQVWTTAPTVAAALGQLGYSTADFTSVSRSQRLPLSPTDIALRTPKVVRVHHDGKSQTVTTTDATVAQLLSDLSITVGPQDRLSTPVAQGVSSGELIVLQRVKSATETKNIPIPYKVSKQSDSSMASGSTKVITAGKNGTAQITYAVVYVDGKYAGRTTVKTVTLAAPTTQVEKVGTKPAIVTSPDAAHQIARTLMLARGWGQDQMDCLGPLWGKESAWRVTAGNQSSGAYGIPQALPGSKMAKYGSDWRTNAETQIKWGLAYIAARYGNPCHAWSEWNAHGGWY